MGNDIGPSRLLAAQRNEKTEHVIYQRFSEVAKGAHNREVLARLAEDELAHHDAWRNHTRMEVQPHRFKVWLYCLLSRILGMSFGLKLMERSARAKTAGRDQIKGPMPGPGPGFDEDEHERQLLRLIDEDRLNYIGALVLGLNDALVELTGALAGFTFALQSPRLVAMTGLITGIAAALSMGGTGYLTAKAEESNKAPLKFALYTGVAYIVTVLLLVLPYLVLRNVYVSLGMTLLTAVVIILAFNFYVSVAKEVSFAKRFGEMAALSLGIAAISFGIGFLVKQLLGVQM